MHAAVYIYIYPYGGSFYFLRQHDFLSLLEEEATQDVLSFNIAKSETLASRALKTAGCAIRSYLSIILVSE